MKIPDLPCQIEAYCSINPSEDPQKVERAISHILTDSEVTSNVNSIKATSKNLKSLSKIYQTIHTRRHQKVYRHHLNKNLVNNSTWFYLNKQAAYVDTVSLCGDAEESPLGPIKVILSSKNIEQIIGWLISDSK